MRFVIEPKPLLKMVEMAGEWQSAHARGSGAVQLRACQGRLCIESGGKIAEAEAVVWESGQCRVAREPLLHALNRHREDPELTIEVDAQGLHFGATCVPVSSFSPHATLPTAFQMFLATDLDPFLRETTVSVAV